MATVSIEDTSAGNEPRTIAVATEVIYMTVQEQARATRPGTTPTATGAVLESGSVHPSSEVQERTGVDRTGEVRQSDGSKETTPDKGHGWSSVEQELRAVGSPTFGGAAGESD
jgi:hypothetical protein